MVASERAPSRAELKRWRQYLADERAEAATYRDLAARRSGEEREILLALAEAEGRHENHWFELLGDQVGAARRGGIRTRLLGWLARRFGSVFVLALAQRAEARSPYADDSDATRSMAADERIHEEVIRGLAQRGRSRISGTFRAGVFGINDGLVSNFALVLGIGATGVSNALIVFTGFAGLLAGAFSIAAGEHVSVSSQRELLDGRSSNAKRSGSVADLDVNANELALVYRARGMSAAEAESRAEAALRGADIEGGEELDDPSDHAGRDAAEGDAVGSARSAALSSFLFFAMGALAPVLPYLFGASGFVAIVVAAALVGVLLLLTGAATGLVSGASMRRRALRQLAIGYLAAAVTYGLGALVGSWLT
ncbi:MAG: VIT1/CCC1 family protein [Terrimesophilobacter sp.]